MSDLAGPMGLVYRIDTRNDVAIEVFHLEPAPSSQR